MDEVTEVRVEFIGGMVPLLATGLRCSTSGAPGWNEGGVEIALCFLLRLKQRR